MQARQAQHQPLRLQLPTGGPPAPPPPMPSGGRGSLIKDMPPKGNICIRLMMFNQPQCHRHADTTKSAPVTAPPAAKRGAPAPPPPMPSGGRGSLIKDVPKQAASAAPPAAGMNALFSELNKVGHRPSQVPADHAMCASFTSRLERLSPCDVWDILHACSQTDLL